MKSRPLAERSHSARLWLFKAMALMNRHIKLRQQRRELGGNIANLQRQPDDGLDAAVAVRVEKQNRQRGVGRIAEAEKRVESARFQRGIDGGKQFGLAGGRGVAREKNANPRTLAAFGFAGRDTRRNNLQTVRTPGGWRDRRNRFQEKRMAAGISSRGKCFRASAARTICTRFAWPPASKYAASAASRLKPKVGKFRVECSRQRQRRNCPGQPPHESPAQARGATRHSGCSR
jgi:hypothetical protein